MLRKVSSLLPDRHVFRTVKTSFGMILFVFCFLLFGGSDSCKRFPHSANWPHCRYIRSEISEICGKHAPLLHKLLGSSCGLFFAFQIAKTVKLGFYQSAGASKKTHTQHIPGVHLKKKNDLPTDLSMASSVTRRRRSFTSASAHLASSESATLFSSPAPAHASSSP